MGGAYQPVGHSRVVTNIVDYGMAPQDALDAPRSFSFEGTMEVERGYSDAVRQELTDLGHKVTIPDVALGGGQAILIDHENGVLQGASDPRKDGCAIGY
jgi:gamma-glutamyltranspeptidase / glutathione hydrolase